MSKHLESLTMANKLSIVKNAIDDDKSFVELSGKSFNIGHKFGEKTIMSNCLLFCNQDLRILSSLNKKELESYKKELEYLLSLTNSRLEEVNNPIEKKYISIDDSIENNIEYINITVKESIKYSDNYGDEFIYNSILEKVKLLNTMENYYKIQDILDDLKKKYNIL